MTLLCPTFMFGVWAALQLGSSSWAVSQLCLQSSSAAQAGDFSGRRHSRSPAAGSHSAHTGWEQSQGSGKLPGPAGALWGQRLRLNPVRHETCTDPEPQHCLLPSIDLPLMHQRPSWWIHTANCTSTSYLCHLFISHAFLNNSLSITGLHNFLCLIPRFLFQLHKFGFSFFGL